MRAVVKTGCVAAAIKDTYLLFWTNRHRGVITANDEIHALERLRGQMRTMYRELSAYRGGVSLLHLEAAVASLESYLQRQRLAS